MTAPPALRPREFPFSDEDFRKIAAQLRNWAGISLPPNKKTLVYSRLAKRLRALGHESFSEYCDFVFSPSGKAERDEFLNALTTNVTSFFRESHHFDHLRQQVLPDLVSRARAGGRVRLWSAGCSTGQEPYSIAITFLEACPDAPRLDVRILATDLDGSAVSTAASGLYGVNDTSGLDPQRTKKWFEQEAAGLIAREPLRRLVHFRQLNLMADWPFSGSFDVIFCRNLVIYFDREMQARLWSRLASALVPEGLLYIGHSERVSGPASDLLEGAGVTTYRRLQSDTATFIGSRREH
ncbi:CheR family methyltransferase [Tranquillimonas alkanivorans]|uniref:Chemotaxis protein methyltransferase n=1 Tax=Tranquillimonas alkanivorans TaxID=441119 RepID=A0A1I5SAP1_9RHOB|nr:protein-glutamate O-methyltransferase [Tranquillimonas alkanivorans]SFP67772.1 chemotaxis protein methyltransferase CheR [Tranquillimonas alkanivorans]